MVRELGGLAASVAVSETPREEFGSHVDGHYSVETLRYLAWLGSENLSVECRDF